MTPRPKSITIVGAGNIGSFVTDLVVRMVGVFHVTIIDRDRYDADNLVSQNIESVEVGEPKAVATGRRINRINPQMEVTAIVDDVRNVPLGVLAADVILSCPDNNAARRVISEAAWRLGVPLIDAGVNAAAGRLAGVTVYVPGEGLPCLQCAWDDLAYNRMEQAHPCDDGVEKTRPTGAPASLGMLAASLQATELQKLLAGDTDHLLAGRRVLVDAQTNSHTVTSYRVNPACRFDHDTWTIRPADIDTAATIGQVFELAGAGGAGGSDASIAVTGQPFVTELQCLDCGVTRRTLRLRGRLGDTDRRCRGCGGKAVPVGFQMADRLDRAACDGGMEGRSLHRAGFCGGDVLTVCGDGETEHYQLGA